MESLLYLRIKELCEKSGITPKQLENECGLAASTIYKWANSSPSFDKVVKVADYFGVSLDYLCGSTDIKAPASSVLSDPDMIAIQRARERSSPSTNKRIMDMLKLGYEEAFKED